MSKKVNILLVEDNEGDILLTQEALEDSKIIDQIDVVKNGKEAMEYLLHLKPFENKKLPDLILLDVNLPFKNGHEVLVDIKNNPKLKHLPVIMLTTSSSVNDISRSYQNYANCYITKPIDVTEFLQAVRNIESFWLKIANLPDHNI